METLAYFLVAFLYTFLPSLAEIESLNSRINDVSPVFTVTPDEIYYLIKHKPVHITCEAASAVRITFKCVDRDTPANAQKNFERFDPEHGRILLRSTLEVTKGEVDSYSGNDDYWCECYAWGSEEGSNNFVQSRRATIAYPFLKRKFLREPVDKSAKVSWRKEGKQINPEEDNNFIITKEGALVIQAAREEDKGRYDCIAKNPAHRRVSRSAKLTIHDQTINDEAEAALADDGTAGLPEKPYFSEQPEGTYYVATGKPVKLTCRVVGADLLTFRCNGRRISRNRIDTSQSQDEKSGAKVIVASYDVTPDELGQGTNAKYSCQCIAWFTRPTQRGWQTARSSSGEVQRANLEENFVRAPSSETVGIGARFVLRCKPPKGNPPAKITWLKGGVSVDPRSDRNLAFSKSGNLIFQKMRKEDEGDYVCVATNPAYSRESSPATLTVTDQSMAPTTPSTTTLTTSMTPVPGQPIFTTTPEKEYFIVKDKPVTIVSRVLGADMQELRCNGRRLGRNEFQTEMSVDPEANLRVVRSSVTITRADVESFNGDYMCQFFVWYIKPGDPNWNVLDGAKSYIYIGYLKDQFLEEPEEQSVDVGDRAEFRCQPPEGKPSPKISWLKDGDKVSGSRYTITKDTLVILQAQMEDAGLYTCVAESKVGRQASSPAELVVSSVDVDEETTTETMIKSSPSPMTDPTTEPSPEPETSTPAAPGAINFVQPPEERYYLVRKKPVEITVGVTGAGILTFECNGNRVARGESETRSGIDPDSGEKVVEKTLTVTEEDLNAWQGTEYYCQARAYYVIPGASGWQSEFSEKAYIEKAFLKRRFVEEPTSETVPLESSVELRCTPPEGTPTPKVMWMKDDQPLDVESDDNLELLEMKHLKIMKMMEQNAGMYQCAAENLFARRLSQAAEISYSVAMETSPEPDMTPTAEASAEPSPEPTPDDEEQSGKAGATYDGPPVFTGDLERNSYIMGDQPAVLMCEATNTMKIVFICNAEQVADDRVKIVMGMDEETGNKTTIASLEVSQDHLKTNPSQSYWCQCYAYYNVPGVDDMQYVVSQKSYLDSAFLGETFGIAPKSRDVEENTFLSLYCKAPDGNPEPELFWRKDDVKLDLAMDDNLVSPSKGTLVFVKARLSDSGTYHCVASNIVGERSSDPAVITIGGKAGEGVAEPEPEPEYNATMATETATEPEMTSEPDAATSEPTSEPEATPKTSGKKKAKAAKCLAQMQRCNSSPARKEDRCAELDNYVKCINRFLDNCKNHVRKETIDFAREARDGIINSCQKGGDNEDNTIDTGTGPDTGCRPLQDCNRQYKENVRNYNADINFACSGLESFLRCVDSALNMCNMKVNEGTDTSLSDIADWFNSYCDEVVVGEGSMLMCQDFRSCQIPVNETVTMDMLYKVSHWCPHIHSTMACTKEAADTCDKSNDIEIQNKIYKLEKSAQLYCPKDGMVEEPQAPSVVGEQGEPENAVSSMLASVLVTSLLQVAAICVFIFR